MLQSLESKEVIYNAAGKLDVTRCVADYAGLVKRMAHHLAAKLPASVQIDDLLQAGMMGLMDACNRFEASQGVAFEAYASQRIRGAMLDELRQGDWLPRTARKAQRDIDGALRKLQNRLHRAPTEAEVAQEMDLPLAAYQSLLQDARGHQLIHYDDFSDADEDNYLERHAPDERDDPLARLHDKRFRESLIQAIEGLPEREKLMMSLYYKEDLNFREIADVLGVSESRVCQIHAQAISRLRSQLSKW